MSILLLHGVGGRPRSWDMVLHQLDPALRRRSHPVDITVAAGQSVVDVAECIIERHPGAHVVVGHSFGGMLAQEIALAHPGRVRGLVLVSTIPSATPRVRDINRALAADIEDRGIARVAPEFAANLFAPQRYSSSPELADAFVTDLIAG